MSLTWKVSAEDMMHSKAYADGVLFGSIEKNLGADEPYIARITEDPPLYVYAIDYKSGYEWIEKQYQERRKIPIPQPQSFRPDAILSLVSFLLALVCVAAVLYVRYGR